MGIAWVSGDGGTRGYWTDGRHRDPLTGQDARGDAAGADPVRGRRVRRERDQRRRRWLRAQRGAAGRPQRAARPTATATTCWPPRRTSVRPRSSAAAKQGHFNIASLEGSYDGEAWRSTRRAQVPAAGRSARGARTAGGLTPGRRAVRAGRRLLLRALLRRRRRVVAYAWYGEGTRFLDISDPANPRQFAYWRPDDALVWASYLHGGYVYTADHVRGVDVLKFTKGAVSARHGRRAVVAPARRHATARSCRAGRGG